MNITLIAHRPDGGDIDNGTTCSELEIEVCTDAEHCAARIAHYRARQYKEQGREPRYSTYAKWEFTILFDGIPSNEDDGSISEATLIGERSEQLLKPLTDVIDAKWAEEDRRKEEERAAQQRRQLERDHKSLNDLERRLGLPVTAELPKSE